MNILVSYCLLGEPCRYDGKSVPVEALQALRRAGHTLVPVCPEKLGGLPTPRAPAELQPDGRVLNREGEDVTDAYLEGARLALEIAGQRGCTLAVLKANSPSCGSRLIYDGTFSGRRICGQGMTARLIAEAGIPVVDEDGLDILTMG
ncbi:MAG: DUF523 domain-containing protein [Lawsonibacter sp.]|nr:DUF523 domain-containing protein [Lawsonibacter sp.]